MVQGNKKLVDAALKKKISRFVLMSSLLTNGKEAGQSLNPGMHPSIHPYHTARRHDEFIFCGLIVLVARRMQKAVRLT